MFRMQLRTFCCRRLWAFGGFLLASITIAGAHFASGRPTSAEIAARHEEYVDPTEMARRFTSAIGEIARQGNAVSPAELARQGRTRRSHRVEVRAKAGLPMSSEALYSAVRESVVVVGGILECRQHPEGHSSFATGFVVHSDGIVVTNQHVVTAFQNKEAIGVMTRDGRVFPVLEVLAADPLNDVAALKIDAHDLSPLPIAGDVGVGAEIHCLSHPALGCSGGEAVVAG